MAIELNEESRRVMREEILHVYDWDSCKEEKREANCLIDRAGIMTSAEIDTIVAAFKQGPLYDGDVPSKSARDLLVGQGYMVRVVVKGEEGYNAVTYKGARLYRLWDFMSKRSQEN